MLFNNMVLPLLNDSVWLDKYKFDDAEKLFHEKHSPLSNKGASSLSEEIASARMRIQNSLKSVKLEPEDAPCLRVQQLESEVASLKTLVLDLQAQLSKAVVRISVLEAKTESGSKTCHSQETKPVSKPKPAVQEQDDDDVDLFGSDEEDADAVKLREERLQQYAQKKSKKTAVIAKSSVVLDVKPWDDETDMKTMEVAVRKIQSDGLVWGASKLVPLAYGILKLQIVAVVEDDKVSIDWLQETIQEIEDLVQSVDIAAFNKL